MSTAADQICERLQSFRDQRTKLAHDIEGWAMTGVSVCSFAPSASCALSVPLSHLDWRRWWEPADEARILDSLRGVLEDKNVPKVAHNWGYEQFVWAWKYGIHVRGIVDDTMIKAVCLYPELEKGLDVCASIYTREPFWKHLSDTEDDEVLAKYNALDSMVCYEINEVMEPLLEPGQRDYYRNQVSLLAPVLDMEFRGFRFDAPARDAMRSALQREVLAMTGELDELAGIPLPSFKEVAETVAMKVKLPQVIDWPDMLRWSKPSYKEAL